MALTSKRAAFFDVDNTLIRGSVIYFVHLFINASWSYVFFYYKQIFLASFVISIIIFFEILV